MGDGVCSCVCDCDNPTSADDDGSFPYVMEGDVVCGPCSVSCAADHEFANNSDFGQFRDDNDYWED